MLSAHDCSHLLTNSWSLSPQMVLTPVIFIGSSQPEDVAEHRSQYPKCRGESRSSGRLCAALELGPTNGGLWGGHRLLQGGGGEQWQAPNRTPQARGEHGACFPSRRDAGGGESAQREPSLGREGDAGSREMTKAQDLLVNHLPSPGHRSCGLLL